MLLRDGDFLLQSDTTKDRTDITKISGSTERHIPDAVYPPSPQILGHKTAKSCQVLQEPGNLRA